MKRIIGGVLIGIGLFITFTANLSARKAPDLAYLMGTFLPGIVSVFIGSLLRRKGKPALPSSFPPEEEERSQNHLRSNAEMGIVGGLIMMLLGSGVAQQSKQMFLLGTCTLLAGWGLLVCGCVNYSRWKRYSGWLGALGLLLLPGLVALICFPKKKRRLADSQVPAPPGTQTSAKNASE